MGASFIKENAVHVLCVTKSHCAFMLTERTDLFIFVFYYVTLAR